MLASDGASAAVLQALDAACGVQHAGAGLVVVLLRGREVAAVLHWRVDGAVTATMTAVAQSLGAGRAVLIVVGSAQVAGRIITACDAADAELIGAGIVVIARIHVRALTDRGMIWTDLSAGAAQDGRRPVQTAVPARSERARISGIFRFLRRR
ncbi:MULTISPECIES: hypothetical protein [Nocardia]|uniref:hypothetical protein n=1 Tax=Nocardia TaxID=1817 RepID=UPI0024547D27|nr:MULTISPECIES: hypothetical protein [Nocardia]